MICIILTLFYPVTVVPSHKMDGAARVANSYHHYLGTGSQVDTQYAYGVM